jgi:RND family efflux transporter MFP subunit
MVAAIAVAGWLAARRETAPEVRFARVQSETLTSLLATNGKTEPLEWSPVHAPQAGRLAALKVKRGQQVSAGAVVAILAGGEAEAALAAAEARREQARTDVAMLQGGGRASELAQIDGTLKKLELERSAALRDAATLQRLVEKSAAPRAELDAVKDRITGIEAQMASERGRRSTLVVQADVGAARARLADAEAAVAQAKRRMEDATIRAPQAGVVFDLPVREGAWMNEGDLVAKVGGTARLRVVVNVDEPEMGKIRTGLPVVITWDAMPGKEWSGVVDQMPTQVVALGTRMVGEVATVVENPGRDLPPGANINARIRAQVVEGAVTIPKSALRREGSELGVFVMESGKLGWRQVTIGVSSETRAEVRSGVKVGDSVALPSERELRRGLEITPVYP